MELERCTRCIMPDTRPGEWRQKIPKFNEDGICQACLNHDANNNVNWNARNLKLSNLCDDHRDISGKYDCLIPVSGGKDSHYLVYKIKSMGMHPLLVNISDPFTHTRAGEDNLHNISKYFNCDLIQFRISEDVFRRSVKVGMEHYGEPLIFVEAAIYTVPIQIAINYGIKLMIHGENPGFEYGTDIYDSMTSINHIKRIFKTSGPTLWDQHGFRTNELNPVTPPQDWENKIYPIFMSYYDRWDGILHRDVAKRCGYRDLTHEWKREGNVEDYDQIDTIGWIMDLWMKYPKFGFARATDILCRWIRDGLIDRESALTIADSTDPVLDQRVLDDFLDFTGYTDRELWNIIDHWYNRDLFENVNGMWTPKWSI